MRTFKPLLLASSLALMASPMLAVADDSPWDASASLSYVLQNGNSKSEALNGKVGVGYQWNKWSISFKGEGGSTRTRKASTRVEERTAEKYYLELREDRSLTDADFLYHLTTYLNDNFTAYAYQLNDSLGYGRKLINNEVHKLEAEIGPGFRLREYRGPGYTEKDATLHVGVKYLWQISESTEFREILQDDIARGGDYTVRNEVGLSTMLNSRLAFDVSHVLVRNSVVPVGTKNSDSTVTVSLTYKFK